MNGSPLIPSPLELINDPLFEQKQIQVYFKRDDLIHPEISGNKWRKLIYNIEAAGKRPVLTFGGAFSNHIAATAAACNAAGISSIGIIRGEESSKLNPTLALAAKKGMKLKFISRAEYRKKNEIRFLNQLKEEFDDPFIIPEGGSNNFGVKGCADILSEIEIDFDHILTAVGTGATIAGISSALKEGQHAIGIPVLKGASYLNEEIDDLLTNYAGSEKAAVAKSKLEMIHDYHFGGYAKITSALIDFMNEFYARHGIKTDAVYSGKSLYALFDLIKNDHFEKGQKIIFYHCGGLQGNKGIEERYNLTLYP
jgi:1-aminocyclopropane-1-carboxylate deaminase/D-cysteine desulfhydrase-like pyridoxal-dependent ACC family enzyme